MKPKTAKKEFEKLVKQAGKVLANLTLADGVKLMLEFYGSVRADGCPFDADGDMLLFQWGSYQASKGEMFQCDLTRQFTEAELEDDDAMSGLSLTFHYTPSGQTAALNEGNEWCQSPEDLADFESFIRSNKAYQAMETTLPLKAALEYTAI